MGLPVRDFQILPQRWWCRNFYNLICENLFCRIVPPQPTGLFCRFFWKYSRMQAPIRLLPDLASKTKRFSQKLSSHSLCSYLVFFLPPITCNTCGASIYTKSAPTRFAAGTTFLRKSRLTVPFHAVYQYRFRLKSLFILKSPSWNVFFLGNEIRRLA